MTKEFERKHTDLALLKRANAKREQELRRHQKGKGPDKPDGDPDESSDEDEDRKSDKGSKKPIDRWDPDGDPYDDPPSDHGDNPSDFGDHHTERPNRVIHNHNTIKYPMPKGYDGSDKVSAENWLFLLNNYLDLTEIPEEKRITFTVFLLSSHALIWWKALVRDSNQPQTWIGFQNRIKQQFKQINPSKKARAVLDKLTQTSTVSTYTAKFRELTLDISDMDHNEMFHKYRNGLQPNIREELEKRHRPNDLQLWIDEALEFDLLNAEHRNNRMVHHTRTEHHPRDNRRPPDRWNKNPVRRSFHRVEHSNPVDHSTSQCYNCGEIGHIKRFCKKPIVNERPKSKFTPKPKGKPSYSKDTRRINSLTLKVVRQKGVPLPAYKTPGSAGMDLATISSGTIGPFTTKRIPTGLSVEIPEGHQGIIHERSSAFTKGLIAKGVIDSDYRGQVDIAIYNGNPYAVSYSSEGQSLTQMVIQPYVKVDIKEVTSLSTTSRKGGFGSTNFHSISTPSQKLLFDGTINDENTVFYLDSGADGVFGGKHLAESFQLTNLDKPLTFTVADNTECTIYHIAKNVQCNIQGYNFKTDILIMPNDMEYVFLGSSWLCEHNPIIDWRKQQMQVEQDDKTLTLRVQQEEEPKKLYSLVSAKNLTMEKGDTFCLVTKADIEADLEIEPDFYDKDREEVTDPDLIALLKKWEHVFRTTLPKEPPTKRNVTHHIALEPGTTPKQTHQYRLSQQHRDAIQEAVNELMERGHIEPSKSPWRSPLLVVIKKDGKLRVVFDYRVLNKNTIDQAYTMKDQYELLELAAGHNFISTMDLTSGYHQIPMDPNSKEKTAFSIPGPKGGQYHFKVMPFGLKGAPATFQQFVDDVFREHLGNYATIYIDDLTTFSDTKEDHLKHLDALFKTMSENDIYVNRKKCYFMQSKVPYLGHYISAKGIEMDPKKIESVKSWPAITTVKQLRGFLGLTGYYRRFMKGYAQTALPLTRLLKNDVEFTWGKEQEEAKMKLIELLTTGPILQSPNDDIMKTIHTDASDDAWGAVLTQDRHPIAFASGKFNTTQRNWSTYEKELFAVVRAFHDWECHLKTKLKFEHFSDNAGVSNIQTQRTITPKQARWIQFLEEFNFKSNFVSGMNNNVADALSRKDIFGITIIDNQHWLDRIRNLSKKTQRQAWMTEENGLFYKDNRLYIPGYRDVKMTIIQENHDGTAGHFGFRKTLERVTRNFYWEKLAQDVQDFVKTCEACQ